MFQVFKVHFSSLYCIFLNTFILVYRIARYTPDMKRDDVEKSFRLAFKMWSDASPLRFIQVNHGKADIILTFARECKYLI